MDKFLDILKIISLVPYFVSGAESWLDRNRTGKEKAKIVQDQVELALQASQFLTERDIKDRRKFASGVKKIADGVVDVFNATVWK